MRVLGVNTGTSVDGVDFALVDWSMDNIKNFNIIHQSSYEFDPRVKQEIEKIINKQEAKLEDISNLNFQYSQFIAVLVKEFLLELKASGHDDCIDLIGMHGQTIFHGPKSTLQIGNTSVIAKLTGVPCIGDFRSADIAVGGCGAPLTSYQDETLIRSTTEDIATLNIGGIANITVMEKDNATIAYDTGPGNILIDHLTKKLFRIPFDKDGAIAYQGRINHNFIEQMILRTEYFKLSAPKSTGRELFDEKYADKFLDLGNKENIITNVSYFTSYTISQELQKYNITKVYIAGGGCKNKFIMEHLTKLNPKLEFLSHDDFGIKYQYKEAILFSLLAFTSYHKIQNNMPSSTGASRKVVLGVLAVPD